MQCAGSTRVSLGEWSPPCRMCGQLLLRLPDRASPSVMSAIGTLCYECYPDFVASRLATLRRWDVQYSVLMDAKTAGLPRSTRAKIVETILAAESILASQQG